MKLDKKDIALLNELQVNCRRSLKKLARKLNMSITTVYDRMKKLEREGVIKGYKAILDPEKTGNPFLAFVMMRVNYNGLVDGEKRWTQKELARRISKIPNVLETHIVAGEWDIILKVRGKDVKELGNVVIESLRNIRGVGRTHTSDVWVTIKEDTELSLRKPIKK